MEPIKVVVYGASGRMGQEVVKAVCLDPALKLAGAVDSQVSGDSLTLPDGSGTVPFNTSLESILNSCRPDVVVDFTVAKATMAVVRAAAEHGVNMVIGTTGFSADDVKEIERLALANKTGVVLAPNFALGAVLMIHLARVAAKFLDYAEIIEMHHERKLDAPSGTALSTARAMAAARGKPFIQPEGPGEAPVSRGLSVDGISVHSVRMPGLMAHQEVILGAPGQTLSIRHDTINRECYMPGVLLAVKEVVNRQGLIYGLDTLLGL
ncbi:4-hydroxy-tetrahydrodipicolinate reductase [Chloroflexota bacterium]